MNSINFDTIALTQSLVKCQSITPHDGGALKILEESLNAIGFQCTRLPFSERGTPDVDNLFGTKTNISSHT